MTTLLENEKVRAFFGCDKRCICSEDTPRYREHLAIQIVLAMEEPIKVGEKVLALGADGVEMVCDMTMEQVQGVFHPYWLRLPDQFQPQRPPSGCECYPTHPTNCHCTCHKAPPPAEKPKQQAAEPDKYWMPHHKPSPTPPEPKCDHACDNYSVIGGCQCKEPRGEFGDDVEAKIEELSEFFAPNMRNAKDAIKAVLCSLVRLALGKGE